MGASRIKRPRGALGLIARRLACGRQLGLIETRAHGLFAQMAFLLEKRRNKSRQCRSNTLDKTQGSRLQKPMALAQSLKLEFGRAFLRSERLV